MTRKKEKLLKPIGDLWAIDQVGEKMNRAFRRDNRPMTQSQKSKEILRNATNDLKSPFAAESPDGEMERKIKDAANQAKAFDSSQQYTTTIAPDPIAAMLDGIRFHNKSDRHVLRAAISNYTQREVAVARIYSDVQADEKLNRLKKTIVNLREELHRSHDRHAADLIEAHGGNNLYDFGEALGERGIYAGISTKN